MFQDLSRIQEDAYAEIMTALQQTILYLFKPV